MHATKAASALLTYLCGPWPQWIFSGGTVSLGFPFCVSPGRYLDQLDGWATGWISGGMKGDIEYYSCTPQGLTSVSTTSGFEQGAGVKGETECLYACRVEV